MCRRIILLPLLFCLFASGQNIQSKSPIYFEVAASSFSATGFWDNSDSDPIPQEAEIDCFKGNMCIQALAEYYMGHPHITVQYFDILKWDNNGVVASDSSGVCMANTLLINFADQTIVNTISPKQLSKGTKPACAFFGASKSQTVAFILKNSDRWTKEHWKGLLPNRK